MPVKVEHTLIVIMGILGGLAAVLAGYTEKLAHHAHARQYDRMRMLFAQALALVDRALDTARQRPRRSRKSRRSSSSSAARR